MHFKEVSAAIRMFIVERWAPAEVVYMEEGLFIVWLG